MQRTAAKSKYKKAKMLSYSHRSQCSFDSVGNRDALPPHDVLDARATCTLQVPPRAPVPAGVERRSRYLITLAADFVCRWHVCAPSDAAQWTQDSAAEAAFYGAIADLDAAQRRRLVEHNTGSPDSSANEQAQKAAPDAVQWIAPCTDCASSALHDWAHDSLKKQFFAIKERPHVLAHFAHPCAHGRQTLLLSKSEAIRRRRQRLAAQSAAGHAATADNADGVARPPRHVHNAMLQEMLSAVNSMRQRAAPCDVAQQVDAACISRQKEARRQMRTQARAAAEREHVERQASRQACASMIERARHTQQAKTGGDALAELYRRRALASGAGGSESSDDANDDYDDDDDTFDETKPLDANDEATWDDENSKQKRGDSSSDTFSSSDDEQDNVQRVTVQPPASWAEVVARSFRPDQAQKHSTECALVASSEMAAVQAQQQEQQSQTQQQAEVRSEEQQEQQNEQVQSTTDERDHNAEHNENVAQTNDDATVKVDDKQCALLQTSVEVMLPVCEPTDSLRFLDSLDSRFLLLWAREPEHACATHQRRRLHVLRREEVDARSYFGLFSQKHARYHVLATIEALV